VSSISWLETSYPERSAPHYSKWLRNGTAWPTSKSAPPIYGVEKTMADDFEVLGLLSGVAIGIVIILLLL
jgi:hypothetical protein